MDAGKLVAAKARKAKGERHGHCQGSWGVPCDAVPGACRHGV